MPKRELQNKKFGRLTVIGPTEKRKNGRIVYLCQCDCGNYVEKTRNDIVASIKNNFDSCCNVCPKTKRTKDLTGEKFGRLTVLRLSDKRYHKSRMWYCQCECGEIVVVPSCHLVNGHKMSCGCLKKEDNSRKCREFLHKDETYKKSQTARGCVENTSVSAITSKLYKNNKSGHKGVHWDSGAGKWKATITFKQRQYRLGRYENIEDAIKARKLAEEMLFEPFLEWYNNTFKGNRSLLGARKEKEAE